MSKVRWIVVYGFVANYTLSSSGKKIENRFRFDKITESLKVGTFSLRHSVYHDFQVSPEIALFSVYVSSVLLFFHRILWASKLCTGE